MRDVRRRLVALVISGVRKLLLLPSCTVYMRALLWLWGGKVGSGFSVAGRMRLWLQGDLVIGRRVRMRSGYSNYVGGHQPMAIWVCSTGKVTIGDDCGLSNTTIVCKEEVTILDGTLIGGGCRIYDMDFHQLQPQERFTNHGEVVSAPIRIGPRAFVGGHCIILKGVTIGEGAVIGAGSVVTRDVPPFEVWAGVPAKRIRELVQK